MVAGLRNQNALIVRPAGYRSQLAAQLPTTVEINPVATAAAALSGDHTQCLLPKRRSPTPASRRVAADRFGVMFGAGTRFLRAESSLSSIEKYARAHPPRSRKFLLEHAGRMGRFRSSRPALPQSWSPAVSTIAMAGAADAIRAGRIDAAGRRRRRAVPTHLQWLQCLETGR